MEGLLGVIEERARKALAGIKIFGNSKSTNGGIRNATAPLEMDTNVFDYLLTFPRLHR